VAENFESFGKSIVAFESFGKSIVAKLIREISALPPAATKSRG